jgi:diguanylate cyclase (GGDEF)-like protein/PAS domain S-box-containing protein
MFPQGMSASDPLIRLRPAASEAESLTEAPHPYDAVQPLLATSTDEQSRVWAVIGEHCSEGIVVCDTEQRIVFVNPAFERVTGYSACEVIGKTPRILRSGQQNEQFYSRMWRTVLETGAWAGEICNRRKNGDLYIEWLSFAVVRDSRGNVAHYVGVFADLTRRKRVEDQVRHLASHDELTQLPNRSLLAEHLGVLLAAKQPDNGKVALLMIDLARFKNINESLGHEAGDLSLQVIASRISSSRRRSDFIARFDGDKFAIVLTDITASDADLVARKILAAIEKPFMLGGREIETSASVGICLYPDDAADASELIRNADTAMHRAKALGRGSRQFYARSMSHEAQVRLDLETALLRAIRQEEFELYYQPQIDLRTGEMIGVEALIRWHRPGVGMVMPSEFIPLAEERELIPAIGAWALRSASAQAVKWTNAGQPPFGVAVNVSSSQFHSEGFVEHVERIFREQAVPFDRMELEITEGVIMRDALATIEILQRLHGLGVALSIDDFGTGYSSLSYLRRFPVHEIKIDQSFVAELTSDDIRSSCLVQGIIELAKSLNLKVIAEGVETRQQLERLLEMGCDRAQGFLFGRPMPADDMGKFLAGWPRRWKELVG